MPIDSSASEGAERLAVIAPLLHADRTVAMVRARAAACGRHPSTLYAWIRGYEAGGLARLEPDRSDGGRGKSRLEPAAEAIVAAGIAEFVAGGGPEPVLALARRIAGRCVAAGVAAPHPNTIRARLGTAAGSPVATAGSVATGERPAVATDRARSVQALVVTTTRPDQPTLGTPIPTSGEASARPHTVRDGFRKSSRSSNSPRVTISHGTTDPGLVICAVLIALVTWVIGR